MNDKMTNGDWFATFGEVDFAEFTERESSVCVLGARPASPGEVRCYVKLRAKRDGKEVEVVLNKCRGQALIDELAEMLELRVDFTKEIEKLRKTVCLQEDVRKKQIDAAIENLKQHIAVIQELQRENENLRKALVMWMNNPPKQIHDSIVFDTPSKEAAETVEKALQKTWADTLRQHAKSENFNSLWHNKHKDERPKRCGRSENTFKFYTNCNTFQILGGWYEAADRVISPVCISDFRFEGDFSKDDFYVYISQHNATLPTPPLRLHQSFAEFESNGLSFFASTNAPFAFDIVCRHPKDNQQRTIKFSYLWREL